MKESCDTEVSSRKSDRRTKYDSKKAVSMV